MISARCARREVSLFGARRRVGAIDAHDDAAPRTVALRIARRVADRVLARQLLGDLAVDVREFLCLVRKERAAAGLERQLTEDELRLLEALGLDRPRLAAAQADRVDRRFRALGKIEDLLER